MTRKKPASQKEKVARKKVPRGTRKAVGKEAPLNAALPTETLVAAVAVVEPEKGLVLPGPLLEEPLLDQPKAPPKFPGTLDIHIGQTKSGQAMFPIRWCLSRDLAECFKAQDISNLYILFIVSKDGKELRDQRSFYPIGKILDYFTFYRPGKHEVKAWLFWMQPHSDVKGIEKAIQEEVIRGVNPRMETLEEIDRGERKNCLEYYMLGACRHIEFGPSATVDVDIAADFFAKPSGWLLKFANIGYEGKPRDECQYRRRLMFTAALSPFYLIGLLISTAFRVTYFGILICRGVRDLNWGWLADIFQALKFYEAYDNRKWPYGLRDTERFIFKHDSRGNRRPLWFRLLAPIYFLLFILVYGAIRSLAISFENGYWEPHDLESTFFSQAGQGLIVIPLLVLALYICTKLLKAILFLVSTSLRLLFLVLSLFTPVLKKLTGKGQPLLQATAAAYQAFRSSHREEKARKKKDAEVAFQLKEREAEKQKVVDKAKRLQAAKEAQVRLYEQLTCPASGVTTVSVLELPKERRTLRLYFLAFKSAVCRPFARD